MMRDQLLEQIKRHEGTGEIVNGRLMPYKDTTGHLTIGYGRNLTANGVSPTEAAVMLHNDIDAAERDCIRFIPSFDALDEVRQAVLTELMFNMGWTTFKQFKHLLAAVDRRDFVAAARALRQSEWYQQVGTRRGDKLVTQLESGLW